MNEVKNERVEKIKTLLMQKHVGEVLDYTGCYANCGGSCCIFKVRIRDGKITAIEPDDHYNVGVGREDSVASDTDLMKNRLQQRACEVAWVWHKQLTLPERVLYPLKRVDGARRGEGRFEKISWDEALTIVAEKLKEAKEKYGPYSIITPYFENPHLDPIFSFLGAGVQGWGWCSMDAERLVKHLMLGYPGWSRLESYDMADMLFNSKLIVLWGAEPSSTRYGPAHQFAYYIRMARERGTPVICIDPRYTDTAAVLADQWIPIKPGTDLAMMIAVAYVLFKQDLYNKEFVERFVEPKGFKAWHDYVMGVEDGVPKTPQWAEEICGVPAETIEGFARLYARCKPTFLFKNWSVARKSYGENVARAAVILQSMMGYIGGPGGYNTLAPVSRVRPYLDNYTAWILPLGVRGKYVAPRMYRSNKWAEAVLLLDDVKEGRLTTEEYRRIIGWRTDPNLPNPNPKVLLWGSYYMGTNYLVTGANATERQIKALEKMEFVVQIASFMTPTAKYADIILPVADQALEDYTFQHDGYGGFANILLCPKIKEPPGEAKPLFWIYTKLAEKLGFGHLYNAHYREGESWFVLWERYLRKCYEAGREEIRKRFGKEIPEFEEFKKSRFFNYDELFDKPLYGLKDHLEKGVTFQTKSGKIEFVSEILADESQRGKVHIDQLGRLIDNLPNDWKGLEALPRYKPIVRGFEDPMVKQYPLFMLTPHSRYRVHSFFWNNPWLRGDCYQHRFWINVADAKARGIRDGDLVEVFNHVGRTRVRAYVTTRIMPGVAILYHGAWYDPDEDGVDKAGCPAVLLHDNESPPTPALVTTLVQVKKCERKSLEPRGR
jgi:anaerobic dimethyl sulfoxide reductase subunit A